jgi:hypothetical protein
LVHNRRARHRAARARKAFATALTSISRVRAHCLQSIGNRRRKIGLAENITSSKEHIETHRVLVAELQHRTRNLMALV